MQSTATTMAAQDVFAEITTRITSRDKRLTRLLRDPLQAFSEGWHMCVPRAFNDALDIRQTDRMIDKKKHLLWTQGSTFSFSQGDTLYDTQRAYEVWSTALQHIKLGIQVERAISSNISDDGSRFPGSITVLILTPNKSRTQLQQRGQVTISQDQFVDFLISGPKGAFHEKVQNAQRAD